jgi:alginate O-acetyltransferase complex protein AlgJ
MIGTPSSLRLFAVILSLIAPLIHPLGAQTSENLPYKTALSGLTPSGDSNVLTGIPGIDGWLFFAPELKHLKATEGLTNQIENPQAIEAIIDFNQQLQKAGIRLLVVPVPGKAAIYPDKLAAGLQPPTTLPFPADSDFCARLRSNGVPVLDLADTFHQNRDKGATLYCKTDSHWSPEGIRIAASEISKNLSDLSGSQSSPSIPMTNSPQSLTFRGDLSPTNGSTETIILNSVSSEGHPVTVSRSSPVLLLGDSHNLVFHSGGDMHAEGAGLPDQLALTLGFPVDLVAVMGSGATAARWSLARRHDNLAGKKIVIWCFTARDLTEGGRWDKVPVIRQSAP